MTITPSSPCSPSGTSVSASVHDIARRSISIFSRRGIEESTDEMSPHIASALMRTLPHKRTESKAPKRPRTKCEDSKTLMGTLLHAVPPAQELHQITSYEFPTAVSPNTEVMSAISERRPMSALLPPHVFSAQVESTNRGAFTNSPIEKRKDSACHIGVWRDGVTHWNTDTREKARVEALVDKDAGAFLDWHITRRQSDSTSDRSSRPDLSVVIPETHYNRLSPLPLAYTAPVQPPAPDVQPLDEAADVTAVSKFNMAAQALSSQGIKDENPAAINLSALVLPLSEQQVAIANRSNFEPQLSHVGPSRSASSTCSTNAIDDDDDDASCYSARSSRTSFETEQDRLPVRLVDTGYAVGHETSSSEAFSIMSPLQAGVFDEPETINLNKPLPPSPTFSPSRKSQVHPSIARSRRNTKSIKPTKSAPGTLRGKDLQMKKSCRSIHRLKAFDEEFMKTDPYQSGASVPGSPTYSEAESDLRTKLRDIQSIPPLTIRRETKPEDDVAPTPPEKTGVAPVEQETCLSRAPTIPTKSKRREWSRRASAQVEAKPIQVETYKSLRRKSASDPIEEVDEVEAPNAARVGSLQCMSSELNLPPVKADAPVMSLHAHVARLNVCSVQSARMSILIPTIVIDDGLIPVETETDGQQAQVPNVQQTPRAAELVLLRIMGSLPNLDDLASVAVINRGMRRVYKQNEVSVLQSVHKNMSPAAWELREWSPPLSVEKSPDMESRILDYTPASYRSGIRQDAHVLTQLKTLILQRCRSFLRPATAAALSCKTDINARRFDEAFYRVWCFCKIFGGDKGREDDVTGQLDWLKGGLLAHQQGCAATVNTNLEYDMCSVLLNAPDHFAKCNEGGMSADDLYDITELWNCLAALLQGYQGRVEQARGNGVYENAAVSIGDTEKEELILEEWIFYILSIGPHAVLELATHSTDRSEAGFTLARRNGWTDWSTAISTGSRSTFLKEPVARLYEERIVAVALNSLTKNKAQLEKKEHSRKRVAGLAAEIRLARCSSSYKRLPLIDMSQERPWSVMSRRSSVASTATSISSRRQLSPPPTQTGFSAKMQGAGSWMPRRVSPIIEDRVERYDCLSYSGGGWTAGGGMVEDTAEKAVKRIVDMGFTVKQAREALRVTDLGHGLSLDGAVDMLLGQQAVGR